MELHKAERRQLPVKSNSEQWKTNMVQNMLKKYCVSFRMSPTLQNLYFKDDKNKRNSCIQNEEHILYIFYHTITGKWNSKNPKKLTDAESKNIFQLFSFKNNQRRGEIIYLLWYSSRISLLETVYSSWCNILFLLCLLWFNDVSGWFLSVLHDSSSITRKKSLFGIHCIRSWLRLFLVFVGTRYGLMSWTLSFLSC